MIVVLDSGIWISGFHFGGVPLQALDQAYIYDQIGFCDEIVSEISIILASKFGWTDRDIRSILRSYLVAAKHVALKGDLHNVCRDPKDDMIFECALRAGASVIISGDRDILDVRQYRGIRVITAREYVGR
ncbi:MAG TPA: putative toxin-antitoxin system toxin component, PIN family [Terriglobales bacterium]|nr:putative toxin-antitoxin system toxin component, PIN family [Terriglobales bacterium]